MRLRGASPASRQSSRPLGPVACSLQGSSSTGTAVMAAPEAGAPLPSGVKVVDPEVLKMAEAWVGYSTTSNPLLSGDGRPKAARTSVGVRRLLGHYPLRPCRLRVVPRVLSMAYTSECSVSRPQLEHTEGAHGLPRCRHWGRLLPGRMK